MFGARLALYPIIELLVIPPVTVAMFAAIMLWNVRGARTLEGQHIYEFSQSGIHLSGPGFDNRVDWSALTRCHASPQALLFLSGNAPLISVPGRVLSPDSRRDLYEVIAGTALQRTGD